ncbi:amidase [Arthrobacter sp. MYb211]|uniref:amidase n=1 Tax=unclassified Arthrobacter TaxID=235627 RepID=UPI000CFD9C74|nr:MULTISPECIES: amidase [unclassified Arthrobacter]PRA10165.1 amidase [Arthrobacter sp. MYb221]PRC05402.1 amidase [Arthrobacter sp. MYb211]
MKTRSALKLRDELASGERSSREVTEHYLRRIDELDSLGAFVYVSPDAMDAAAAADEKQVRGQIGRLHGLPSAFKDLNEVAGMPTTYGSAAMEHQLATADHPLVARLRSEGVVITGKTQVPEFGLSSYSENLVAPPSRNPLDPRLTSGGSSGGQAAAVAAGMIPVGPGSDGGGSVRIPAAACGLVGLKPSLGRVPSDVVDGYLDAFGAPKMTVSGPLAHDALDAAMLLDAMRGSDHFLPLLRGSYPERLKGLRIGYSTLSPFESAYPITLQAPAREAFERAKRLLEARHRVEPADLHYAGDYPETFARVWTNGLRNIPVDDESLLGELARDFRRRSTARSLEVSLQAASRLKQIAADFVRQWSAHDVILTPAMASTPPEIGYFTRKDADTDYMLQCQYTPYTSMVNVSSVAAITVPITNSSSGMPMSVQLISPRADEGLLLALAKQLGK